MPQEELDRIRVIRQFSENLSGYPLGFQFVGKVFLNTPSRLIKGELVHCLTAIDRAIEFDSLSAI
jgi:hypothetical protein